MNSSNSFNICPRCGNSNSLNAKYCSRCGAQLKVPQEAVVCHKCHTRNSSLANFCRNCGATLKVGAQTKICPRCGRELGVDENICACGYSFVTLQQTEPRQVNVASTNKDRKKDKKHGKKHSEQQAVEQQSTEKSAKKSSPSRKGGRGFAIFALVLLAVFIYAVIAPMQARPDFLTKLDKGFYNHPATGEEGGENAYVADGSALLAADGDESGEAPDVSGTENGGNSAGNNGDTDTPETTENLTYIYGYSLIEQVIALVTGETFATDISEYEGGAFAYLIEYFGSATFVMIALLVVFMLTALFHLIVCIARIVSKKRSTRSNILFLVLAIVTTLLTALMIFSHYLPGEEGFLATVREFLTPKFNGIACSYGYALFIIPIYYWVFWLYSCLAKTKKVKKSKKDA